LNNTIQLSHFIECGMMCYGVLATGGNDVVEMFESLTTSF